MKSFKSSFSSFIAFSPSASITPGIGVFVMNFFIALTVSFSFPNPPPIRKAVFVLVSFIILSMCLLLRYSPFRG